MFIYRRQLEELSQYRNHGNPMASLYLNVTPPREFRADMNSLLHTTKKHLKKEERFDEKRLDGIDRVFKEMEKHVKHGLQRMENTRMVVLFANASGFWQEYHLPVGLPSQLVVEPDPYIRPISALLDEFSRFLVLVADSRHARLFSLYLGDFEEHPDVFIESEVPDRVRVSLSMTAGGGAYSTTGISGGLGDKRIERHIQDQIHKHLKTISDRTFEYFREKNYNRLIIGTPDDKTRVWLKEHLHSYLQRRLGAEFNAQPETNDHELKLMALDAAAECERWREQEIVDELFEKSGGKGLGVLGVEPVIKALRMGQVHTLLIEHGFQTGGFLCPHDHIVSMTEESCPLCGEPMQAMDDIVDEMIEEAISQNSEVQHIFLDHADFKKHHAGAILRFTLAE